MKCSSRSLHHPYLHVPAATMLRIGDMMWVTFPGELISSIGKEVKAAEPAAYAYFMGYTNGYIGYFPTQKTFGEGGYEPSNARIAPSEERIYLRKIAKMTQFISLNLGRVVTTRHNAWAGGACG
ncbi:MAG: hypothetical protein ACRD28_04070 [Acidobacteriaceae bacterium]